MNHDYLTVAQLTRYIKYRLDNDANLKEVYLKGEISNFKAHTRGHYYFTLKDETSRINAIMFASNTKKITFLPEDGMTVLVKGKISVYEATGGYQIYVEEMTEDGVGNLYVAFEQLKKKLGEEGLFDPLHKKAIPRIPEVIGIVTAPTGAAVRDILSTIRRRWPLAKTILFPSLVQGKEAAEDIVKNIHLAETYPLDVLLVGRGGGSIEDMWCFNDEQVARAIYQCPIPVISAVGHEIDFTIADFVADLRAPTPTGAAEMAVPDYRDIVAGMKQWTVRLEKSVRHHLEQQKERLFQLKHRPILTHPLTLYERKEEDFDRMLEKLLAGMERNLEKQRHSLEKIKTSYLFMQPDLLYQKQENQFQNLLGKLETLNPLLTLKRGYAIVKKEGKVLSSVAKVKAKDTLDVELQDGVLTCQVL